MKIYVCKANSTPVDTITSLVSVLEQNDNEVVQYLGGAYDNSLLPSCKSLVAIIPEPVGERFLVGRGQHGEIEKAMLNHMKAYVYRDKQFYQVITCMDHDTKNWKTAYGILTLDNESIPDFIKLQDNMDEEIPTDPAL